MNELWTNNSFFQHGEIIDPGEKEPNWEQGFSNVCVERGDRNVVQAVLFKHVNTGTS
jgi:hypothetical protein